MRLRHQLMSTRQIVFFLLVVSVLFYQLLAVWFPVASALEFYYAHLGMILVVLGVDLLFSTVADANSVGMWKKALLGLALICAVLPTIYFYVNVTEIELRQPFITPLDLIAGIALIVSVLILSWYIWGKILTGLMVLSMAYFVFGNLFPQPFTFSPPDIQTIVSYLTGMGGARGLLWGIPLSANTLFLIIVFGGLLKGTHILDMFNEVGKLLLSITRGGVCYSAVFASSAIGMVTGQAVANIALSGSMTIPSMQQRGLSAEQAGAVEVTASLGSQLIPPIMGLGGFLMAVNLGIPYVQVAAAAVIPAILFVATLLVVIRFMVQATPSVVRVKERTDIGLVFWILPSFLISFVSLVVLLYFRYSPSYAAFWAILLVLGLSFCRPKRHRPSWRELISGTSYGVVSACQLALILAGIGLIVQVLITTGAGFDLGRVTMQATGGHVVLGLFFGMLLCLFVGMGLPTPAAYALLAIIMIPFLIDLGVTPIVAHFFGFYFAIFSAVTPPVAVGVMTATRISGGSFYGTATKCMKLSTMCILIPYSFVAFPILLEFPRITATTLIVSMALMLASAGWAAAIYGVFNAALDTRGRLIAAVAPCGYLIMLITQNLWFGLLPLISIIALAATEKWRDRARPLMILSSVSSASSKPLASARNASIDNKTN